MTYLNYLLFRAIIGVLGLPSRLREEHGQDIVEYALLSGLIAVTLIALVAFTDLQNALKDMAAGIGRCIDFDSSAASNCGLG